MRDAAMFDRRAFMLLVGWLATLLTAAPGAGQSQRSIAGTYCLTGVLEVGSCFRFSPDQKFEYFLSYGAYDEASEGHWRLDGNEVILESAPYDRKPGFVFKESRATGDETFKVVVVSSTGRGIAGVDARVICDGRTHEGYTQQEGYGTQCASLPGEIALGIRMVGLAYQVVPINGAQAAEKALVFTFEPGDLGKKAFTGTRLQFDGDGLRMTYRNPAMTDHDGRRFSYRRN